MLYVITERLLLTLPPETKDRTLEEIDEMFMNVSRTLQIASVPITHSEQKVPARKFKSYVITKNIQGISVQAEMDILAQKLAVPTVQTVERAA